MNIELSLSEIQVVNILIFTIFVVTFSTSVVKKEKEYGKKFLALATICSLATYVNLMFRSETTWWKAVVVTTSFLISMACIVTSIRFFLGLAHLVDEQPKPPKDSLDDGWSPIIQDLSVTAKSGSKYLELVKIWEKSDCSNAFTVNWAFAHFYYSFSLLVNLQAFLLV